MQRLFSLLIIWLSACFGLTAFAETAEDSDNAPIVYPRTVVYEKGTATWCGYCPIGSYIFDELSQHHPEQFIGIAVHNRDEMTTHTYNGLIFSALPKVHIDRNVRNASFSLDGFENQFLTAAARPAPALVEASFKRTEERKFELTVRTTYGKDAHNLDLRLAYVVLEDSVGPDFQANYYSRGGFSVDPSSGFYKWTQLPGRTRTYFNDVAREIYPDAYGQPGSIPTTMQRGVPHTFVFTDCYLPSSVHSFKNVHIAVLLLDNRSGSIVNAAHLTNRTLTGVNAPRRTDVVPTQAAGASRRFDLSGRALPTPTRGLNIENGQKVWR
jgi:hypothetical protein